MGGEVVEENGGQIDGDGRGFDCGWSTCNAIDRVHVIDINQKDMKRVLEMRSETSTTPVQHSEKKA